MFSICYFISAFSAFFLLPSSLSFMHRSRSFMYILDVNTQAEYQQYMDNGFVGLIFSCFNTDNAKVANHSRGFFLSSPSASYLSLVDSRLCRSSSFNHLPFFIFYSFLSYHIISPFASLSSLSLFYPLTYVYRRVACR